MRRPRNEHRPAREPDDKVTTVRERPPIGFASAPIVGLKSYRARISAAARRATLPGHAGVTVGVRAPVLRVALKPG